jgi:hypothetical protein
VQGWQLNITGAEPLLSPMTGQVAPCLRAAIASARGTAPDRGDLKLRPSWLHPTAKRLAIREYLPLAGWVLTWLLIGLSLGHADVVRLLAANTLVQSVRAIATLEVIQVLARRSASPSDVRRRSLRTALQIDLPSLLACIVLTAALVGVVAALGMPQAAGMIAIVALAIPARNPGALAVSGRDRDTFWRIGSAVTSVAGAAAVLLLELPWQWAAAVLAAREWGGLLATALFAGPRSPPRDVPDSPITFREAAVQTEATARKRLGYRLLRTLLILFGPLGSFAARTGRGAGRLDQKIGQLMPRSRAGFAMFTAAMLAIGSSLLILSREPASLLAAAAALRLAASGGAALLWWKYRDDRVEDDDDD